MSKDTNKNDETKKKIKQINDTCQIDRVEIYVDEDLEELDKIAKRNVPSQFRIYIIIFSLLFLVVLLSSIAQIHSFYERQKIFKENSQEVSVNKNNSTLMITNDSKVNGININSINLYETTEATTENISKLSIKPDVFGNAKKTSYKYNVRYRIFDNNYEYLVANNDPEVYVRFAYSTDGIAWTYVNTAISTTNSTLVPQMGNYYDITGIESTINVATNHEIVSNPEKEVVVYWKAETTYRHLDYSVNQDTDKKLNATFNVEYTN